MRGSGGAMNEPSSESQRSGQGRWRNLFFGLGLVTAVVLCFSPALPGDFLWDDDLHITANPTIVGPLGLKEIWTTAAATCSGRTKLSIAFSRPPPTAARTWARVGAGRPSWGRVCA